MNRTAPTSPISLLFSGISSSTLYTQAFLRNAHQISLHPLQKTKTYSFPFYEKWSIIKTKTSVYSFGGKYTKRKPTSIQVFSSYLNQKQADFRFILPGRQFLPLVFLPHTRNWKLLSSFEGSSATLRHKLFSVVLMVYLALLPPIPMP